MDENCALIRVGFLFDQIRNEPQFKAVDLHE
jgi:hypothetical protein